MSEVNYKMLKDFVNNLDKLLVKSMDFSQFLATSVEDLEIEQTDKSVEKSENLDLWCFKA